MRIKPVIYILYGRLKSFVCEMNTFRRILAYAEAGSLLKIILIDFLPSYIHEKKNMKRGISRTKNKRHLILTGAFDVNILYVF